MPNGLYQFCDDFERGYIEAALWTEEEEIGKVSPEELPHETIFQMREDCSKFRMSTEGDKVVLHLTDAQMLGMADDSLGHDFWLTRNRHGGGFWDRGLGKVGEVLTARAHSFGECTLFKGDDGQVRIL